MQGEEGAGLWVVIEQKKSSLAFAELHFCFNFRGERMATCVDFQRLRQAHGDGESGPLFLSNVAIGNGGAEKDPARRRQKHVPRLMMCKFLPSLRCAPRCVTATICNLTRK